MSSDWFAAAMRGVPRSFRLARRRTIALSAVAVFCMFLIYQAAWFSPSTVVHKQAYEYTKSSFDWTGLQPRYPRKPFELAVLPTGKPLPMPRIQLDSQDSTTKKTGAGASTLELRRKIVKQAFQKCWKSYKEQAWLRDELQPISGGGKTTFGGLAATLVDALDTLWIMDMKDDFEEAVAAVASLDFSNIDGTALNMFETTIRHLGGLLSAYDLSGDEILLRKARDLGDMLYVAFDTPNHLPGFWMDFKKAKEGKQRAGTGDPSASPGSLSLEFTRLAQLTGDSKYYSAIDRVTTFLEHTQNQTKLPGMWPTTINFANELATNGDFTLGGLADSLYEYLPKMHALLGGLDPRYEKMYRAAATAAEKHLLFRPMLPKNDDILFSGNVVARNDQPRLVPEAQHLGCFLGGMFALAGKLFGLDNHIGVADRIARGCVWAYSAFPLGIMPEVFHLVPCNTTEGCAWDEEKWEKQNRGKKTLPKGVVFIKDSRYILRPEAIESLFILHRITGGPDYQEMAWTMFESVRAATETEIAFTGLADVTVTDSARLDSMESFWMAETLKYLYLIFSPPDVISLDKYVFNTEAHPFKRP